MEIIASDLLQPSVVLAGSLWRQHGVIDTPDIGERSLGAGEMNAGSFVLSLG